MPRSETFYAPTSWLSTTKIFSITEKRALLNSAGIDIHSEACYIKVTTLAERKKERKRGCRLQTTLWTRRKREGGGGREAEKWHEGKLEKKNCRARGGANLPDWEGQPIPQFAIHKVEVGGENSLVCFIDASFLLLSLPCPFLIAFQGTPILIPLEILWIPRAFGY